MSIAQEIRIIDVLDAPDIPGLFFRHFRGEEDYPFMAYILTACKDVDKDERMVTVEDIARDYGHLNRCDPYQDMVFAEVGGEVIGYGRCTWWQEESEENPRIYVGFGWVIPAWRRKGIGRAMLRYQEEHLREIAAGHDHDGPRYFQAWVNDSEVAKKALIESEGYKPITYGAEMVRPTLDNIPDLPLPEGLVVYPSTEDHLRAIWDADVEAFRDHWGFAEPTEEDYLSEMVEFPHRDMSLWRVAWDGHPDEGGIVAGQVRSFIDAKENEAYGRKRGYTEFISVRRPYRRKGLAKALIARSLQAIKDRGMEEAALGVHTENPNGAFQLYQAMGYEVIKTSTTYRKPMK